MNVTIGTKGRRPARGFSLLELMIVVGITLVVAAVAIPQVLIATQNFKLRGTASSLSGLIQKCRMLAVARNATCPPGTVTCSQNGYYAVKPVFSGGVYTFFVDMDGNGTINPASVENTSVLAPPDIVPDSSANPANTSMSLGSTPVVGLPAFNARGLPCVVASGTCTVAAQGLIYYLRQDRSIGATGWAAVTVSSAGRAQVWTWDGSKWE